MEVREYGYDLVSRGPTNTMTHPEQWRGPANRVREGQVEYNADDVEVNEGDGA